MAQRPVFIIRDGKPYVKEVLTEFRFYPGFALAQSRRCIESLHESFVRENPEYGGKILEISSKSGDALGVQLSAFHLRIRLSDGTETFVENAFQAGKCFAGGRQYTELLGMAPAEAKRFPGIRSSGEIVKFRLEGAEFPTEPKTFFYNWLYVRALNQSPEAAEAVMAYHAFTDIVFNPAKSLNCQARAAAMFVSLKRAGMLEEALSAPESFIRTVYEG